jgi:hypothetical protein
MNKTAQQWIDEKKVKILDPDGFRELGPQYRQVEMAEDEFNRRLSICTVAFNADK